MDESKTGSANDLFQFVGAESEIQYDGQCHQAGCQNQGFSFDYPPQNHQAQPDTSIDCHIHRTDIGYCFYCDQPGDIDEGCDPEGIYIGSECMYQLDQEWEYRPGHDDEHGEDDY